MRSTLIINEPHLNQTTVHLTNADINGGMEMLCSAIVVLLRGEKRRGGSVADTQKRLDDIKHKIWHEALEMYDNPDISEIHPSSPISPVIHPTQE